MKFWRCRSRRIYAVLEDDLPKPKSRVPQKRKANDKDSDVPTDSEVETPNNKQQRSEAGISAILNQPQELNCGAVQALLKYMKLPPAFYSLLSSSFNCNIHV